MWGIFCGAGIAGSGFAGPGLRVFTIGSQSFSWSRSAGAPNGRPYILRDDLRGGGGVALHIRANGCRGGRSGRPPLRDITPVCGEGVSPIHDIVAPRLFVWGMGLPRHSLRSCPGYAQCRRSAARLLRDFTIGSQSFSWARRAGAPNGRPYILRGRVCGERGQKKHRSRGA